MPIADPVEPAGLRVFKRGNATCFTEGVLYGLRESANCPNFLRGGNLCFFNKCFAVSDLENSSIFFKEGDSGSGVFVFDKPSQRLKALGIAFARQMIREETLVCKLNEISRVFNLALSKEILATKLEKGENEMEICV